MGSSGNLEDPMDTCRLCTRAAVQGVRSKEKRSVPLSAAGAMTGRQNRTTSPVDASHLSRGLQSTKTAVPGAVVQHSALREVGGVITGKQNNITSLASPELQRSQLNQKGGNPRWMLRRSLQNMRCSILELCPTCDACETASTRYGNCTENIRNMVYSSVRRQAQHEAFSEFERKK